MLNSDRVVLDTPYWSSDRTDGMANVASLDSDKPSNGDFVSRGGDHCHKGWRAAVGGGDNRQSRLPADFHGVA